ncbi:MAG: hypothetical protein B5M54_06320 [Candidatus Aminicenantes bacterium 4484_214]|nr:MAG: hypothetical protein B5M54_06320 [Candidatus Aminicenantes bacterium 4484_214]
MISQPIVLIGADGQLGTDLATYFQENNISFYPLYYPQFDITRPEKARRQLASLKPKVVINTAAYHRVDECEDYPERAFLVNALAVRHLALICGELESSLVHFSTDYVFDGQKKNPYVEEDCPRPLSVYAASKLAGEYFVQAFLERYFLIRTCGLYGVAGCWGKGTNWELAEKIAELLKINAYGLYHLTNEGQCTWFEFAQKIFEYLNLKPELIPVSSQEFGAKARRPPYSVLENKKAKALGLTSFSPWEEALKDYLQRKSYLAGDKR